MTLENLLTSIAVLQKIMIHKGSEIIFSGFVDGIPYSVIQTFGNCNVMIRTHNFNRLAIEILPE